MEFSEDPDHVALRAAVSAVVRDLGPTYYRDQAAVNGSTDALWRVLGAQGLIAPNIPEEHGGGGAGMTELAIVCEQVAAEGSPLLLILVSSAICAEVLTRYGSPDQQAQWLPRLASGETKMVFAITEPDAGSNTHQLATRATRDGDGWVLRGTKHYISGVDEAEAVLVVARTGSDPATDRALLSLFIVPTDAPGLVAQRLPVGVQMPERQFTLFFDDVHLGPEQLVGTADEGFAQVFHGLNPERITGAALCVGLGRHALARAADYARTRAVWGGPIGAHQALAHALAAAQVQVDLAALMTAKAAWLHDAGLPAGEASNMAKYAAAEAALEALDAAIQTHGGNGVSDEFGLLPLWGMARVLRIAPVSREMVLNHIAQHTLRLPRSY
jgi:alkylation response protein AidB-like acyl-CoA dehydrogenase